MDELHVLHNMHIDQNLHKFDTCTAHQQLAHSDKYYMQCYDECTAWSWRIQKSSREQQRVQRVQMVLMVLMVLMVRTMQLAQNSKVRMVPVQC